MDIVVAGSDRVVLPAQCVRVRLTVGFTERDADSSVRATSTAVDGVRARLDAAVSEGGGCDVRLSGLRTWAQFIHEDEGDAPGAQRFVTEVRGSATIVDLTMLGGLLGDLASTGGVEIEGLDWQLTDETSRKVMPEVLRGAFEDARQRAEWIADAAGHAGLDVASIEDLGASSPGTPRAALMGRASGGASFDLDPADVEVSASLTVRFATTGAAGG